MTSFLDLPNEIVDNVIKFYVANNSSSKNFPPDSRCSDVFSNYINTELNLISQLCENSSSDLCQMIQPYVLLNHDSHMQRMYIVENITKIIHSLGFNTTDQIHPCQEIASIAQSIDDTALKTAWPKIVDQIHSMHPNLNLDGNMSAAQIRVCMAQNAQLLQGFTNLDLSELDLYSLPKEISLYFTGLQTLDLARNKLQTVPPQIASFVNLRSLDLTHNQFKTLPEEFGNLIRLRELSLADNMLTDLPEEFGKLSAMKRLDLSGNQFTALPVEILDLVKLRELDLSKNKLEDLPNEFGKLVRLKELDLSQNELRTLPDDFKNLTRLEVLDLYQNKLHVLPNEFGNLAGLSELNLSKNRLAALPLTFNNLANHLQVLDLRDNRFKALPVIGDLVALQQLDLSKNFFETLPSFGNLVNVRELSLSQNPLKALPARISSLVNLRKLSLDQNLFNALPPRIKGLPNLRLEVSTQWS